MNSLKRFYRWFLALLSSRQHDQAIFDWYECWEKWCGNFGLFLGLIFLEIFFAFTLPILFVVVLCVNPRGAWEWTNLTPKRVLNWLRRRQKR